MDQIVIFCATCFSSQELGSIPTELLQVFFLSQPFCCCTDPSPLSDSIPGSLLTKTLPGFWQFLTSQSHTLAILHEQWNLVQHVFICEMSCFERMNSLLQAFYITLANPYHWNRSSSAHALFVLCVRSMSQDNMICGWGDLGLWPEMLGQDQRLDLLSPASSSHLEYCQHFSWGNFKINTSPRWVESELKSPSI